MWPGEWRLPWHQGLQLRGHQEHPLGHPDTGPRQQVDREEEDLSLIFDLCRFTNKVKWFLYLTPVKAKRLAPIRSYILHLIDLKKCTHSIPNLPLYLYDTEFCTYVQKVNVRTEWTYIIVNRQSLKEVWSEGKTRQNDKSTMKGRFLQYLGSKYQSLSFNRFGCHACNCNIQNNKSFLLK